MAARFDLEAGDMMAAGTLAKVILLMVAVPVVVNQAAYFLARVVTAWRR